MHVPRDARVRDRLLPGIIQMHMQSQLRISIRRLRLWLFRWRHRRERVREEDERHAEHIRASQMPTIRVHEHFHRPILDFVRFI